MLRKRCCRDLATATSVETSWWNTAAREVAILAGLAAAAANRGPSPTLRQPRRLSFLPFHAFDGVLVAKVAIHASGAKSATISMDEVARSAKAKVVVGRTQRRLAGLTKFWLDRGLEVREEPWSWKGLWGRRPIPRRLQRQMLPRVVLPDTWRTSSEPKLQVIQVVAKPHVVLFATNVARVDCGRKSEAGGGAEAGTGRSPVRIGLRAPAKRCHLVEVGPHRQRGPHVQHTNIDLGLGRVSGAAIRAATIGGAVQRPRPMNGSAVDWPHRHRKRANAGRSLCAMDGNGLGTFGGSRILCHAHAMNTPGGGCMACDMMLLE
eukprot:CAMPEP_0117588316 /NCGR_PEP_ID=MMETSP0784-20121206/69788_1 /TAXON_ID=39447 /ORGANISM="" /LENGTH=319 /DNA_ID=CAMNT_0005389671 /DNA_START=195 /DNA_END=1155 /DNA_ORIENTATION=+